MDKIVKEAVERYQCPGCVGESDTSCYEKGDNLACKKHCAGTFSPFIGTFFLGMPKGFDRLGLCAEIKIHIFRSLKESDWNYDKFNVFVWKYLDEYGNTITRGLSPRINSPWIHIFLENCIKDIDCMELTDKDLNEMD